MRVLVCLVFCGLKTQSHFIASLSSRNLSRVCHNPVLWDSFSEAIGLKMRSDVCWSWRKRRQFGGYSSSLSIPWLPSVFMEQASTTSLSSSSECRQQPKVSPVTAAENSHASRYQSVVIIIAVNLVRAFTFCLHETNYRIFPLH
jgi:hypothetical protein